VEDSLALGNGLYEYKGGTFLELEIPELTQIAWETTRSLSITNEFNYECLYSLESMYNSQRRVQNEVNKATDALQRMDLKGLMAVLRFLEQLDEQLLEDYKEMIEIIDDCGK
jgi:hypothetical protein